MDKLNVLEHTKSSDPVDPMVSCLPEKVASFRAHYRQHYQPQHYSGWLHILFTVTLASGIIIYSAIQLHAVSGWQWLTVPLTLMYANIVEYFAHRFPMHRPYKKIKIIFRRHARQHHRFFTEKAMHYDSTQDLCAVLFPPYLIAIFFICFALPVGLLLNWLFAGNVAYLFVISAFIYFLNYELLHTVYHLPKNSRIARLPLIASLRRLHQHHHNQKLMSHYNFNITYPIGDWLFGTYYRGEQKHRKT